MDNNVDLKILFTELQSLRVKIEDSKHLIKSEEHTKMAYILPFIKILGYDTFNPAEVIPEYTCDFGTKKGEKVDFCLMDGNKPYILVECKDCRNKLNSDNISQLFRYFTVSSAKIAILTNGIEYLLFTDSVEKNKMDMEPFYSFSMLDLKEQDMNIISMLMKENINNTAIVSYSKIALFRNEVDKWVLSEKDGISKDFIHYIRKKLNTYGLGSDEIAQVLQERLFSNTSQEIVSNPKESTIESESIKTELNDSDSELSKGIKRQRTAIGTTGKFTLSTPNIENLITGSRLLGVNIGGSHYEYTNTYQILCAILDYLLDEMKVTPSELISRNNVLEIPILYSNGNEDIFRNYRGVFFRKSISGQFIIKFALQLCNVFKLSSDLITIYLIDSDAFYKLRSLSIDFTLFNYYLDIKDSKDLSEAEVKAVNYINKLLVCEHSDDKTKPNSVLAFNIIKRRCSKR